MSLQQIIRKYSLANAIRYGGKASPGNVMGKILGENPEYRSKAKEVGEQIKKMCDEVNALSFDQQKEALMSIAPELVAQQENQKTGKESSSKEILKALQGVEPGNVVMRFEPSPSGPMHIGHTYPLMLNYAYCKRYDGKLILRIADTNPDNIYAPAYDLLTEDFDWLCPDIKKEVLVQSDRMEIYYKYTLQLIEQEHAYVCQCSSEEFKELVTKKIACPCRAQGKNKNEKLWQGMLLGSVAEGDAVVRLKTDITHPNPAMRDFPLLRINENEHPRQGKKYRVWPLLNLAVAIDDHDMGLTHVLRGKDHYDNTKRQKYIFDYLGWKHPHYLHIGRINFLGLKLSTTTTKKEIAQGAYDGWNDVRLPFIPALKRRGYQPHAFERYALSVGVTLNDKSVESHEFFKTLHFFNKEKIEPIAHRYFFIENPKEVVVENAPTQKVELDLHPDFKKGGRVFETMNAFFVNQDDFDSFEDSELIRLMDCLNFRKQGDQFFFDSLEYEKFKEEKGKKIIHWLPKNSEDHLVPVELLDETNHYHAGFGEVGIKGLQEGTIIQFERRAYVRLEKKGEDKHLFLTTHK